MQLIKRDSSLWSYLTDDLRGLVEDGEFLLEVADQTKKEEFLSDYSYLVFPFAKAYEGFLKKFFLDTKLIHEEEYYSDDIRIGRILNPHFDKEKQNVFRKICNHSKEGRKISSKLWETWKKGRNLVFHYFPHNFRRLSYQHSLEIIQEIISSMNSAIMECNV
ncbi:hypothetical protein A3K34_00325 [candidate division WWE3 bacterium RIFOXYC1_FULL_40_10]|uniref:Uncharacterized protein n=1 Tax=candidate division WWE3 bacterium RIFOXYA2_FULL_46_9 TaxID=1802636 RepID=A0A1F4W1E9_UNCKA|nr:MAG: hypothetical protein A3K58_00325 [candidate division WWE3 bacterium RIFOXYB1_FULL_40_22]OGC61337.1 MAG: hypothetical protein A3K37_00325 [candidate division WWE3 bacterium RIFOXYA1_FULL_40_11]OGC63247.1 MAG: hypothetical protein A2264_00980 [candidate division WWE3 bacterium RIFOXYA2_FULL_46_9]OGC65327.1 MAG: hypothetical protein A2326_04610 [candidate division WWE3 bacterium RIFOXYB2_FULL_41_6]OGC65720.1 MAG: hypothetical protein A3K34_00325 [candidate division WWE3 bacterium RIFOXYC1_